MRNVKVLDCTLRDGGRIFDCKFPDTYIRDISEKLSCANIDIIELGFLRDWRKVNYKGNSTFFTKIEQIKPFVNKAKGNAMYVAFVDFGMFDFDTLAPNDGTSIDGIRVGFTKSSYLYDKEEIIRCLKIVKEKGYSLFIQGVNTPGYSDKELLEIVDMVNEVHPYSFGIVDTYGSMYVDDVRRIYDLVDHNLLDDVSIDFHSHNNFQLSFSFAQEVIKLSKTNRKLIIDSTLNGMGKCAGNLNTELIVDFLVRKMGYNYDFDALLDIIDEYMYSIKKNCSWGYSIPSVMAGIYRAHPNNVIYLTEKFRLATKDIRHIMSMINPEVRQHYDYDNIQKIYQMYNHTKVDDREAIEIIKGILKEKELLLLLPGYTLVSHADVIEEYIRENSPFIISVNFVCDMGSRTDRFAFFGSSKRYKKFSEQRKGENIVVVSNIEGYEETDIVINYESLIERENDDFDNTMIMLLNLLKRLNIFKMTIAGFDGYSKDRDNYFDKTLFEGDRFENKIDCITENMRKMLKKYSKCLIYKTDIKFLTPSNYSDIFKEKEY